MSELSSFRKLVLLVANTFYADMELVILRQLAYLPFLPDRDESLGDMFHVHSKQIRRSLQILTTQYLVKKEEVVDSLTEEERRERRRASRDEDMQLEGRAVRATCYYIDALEFTDVVEYKCRTLLKKVTEIEARCVTSPYCYRA